MGLREKKFKVSRRTSNPIPTIRKVAITQRQDMTIGNENRMVKSLRKGSHGASKARLPKQLASLRENEVDGASEDDLNSS